MSKGAFVSGNIKPDMDRSMRKMPHRFEPLSNYLVGLLDSLRMEGVDMEVFSEKLGILCHFLCDSFCSYHMRRELRARDMVEHFL